MLYPCPSCGFEVFVDSSGSYDICPICDWEDDGVQLRFPFMKGGANGECLFEWQQKVLKDYPLNLCKVKGFQRDKLWRPLTEKDYTDDNSFPKTGFDYFQAIDEETPNYYWRK